MRPDDLTKISTPTDVCARPNGQGVAFVVSIPDIDEDRYDRRIWATTDTGPRPFTRGPSDTTPRWSPDGRRLAFLRRVEGKGMQAAVMAADGGEATIVSDFGHGMESLEWSPNGHHLLVVAVTPTNEWEDLDDDEVARRPRRLTTVPYRYDNKGWVHDRRRHLWLIDPDETTNTRCLTPGDHDEETPAWSPDGSTVAFLSDRDEHRGLVSGNHVWEIDVSSGEIGRATPRGLWVQPSYRPDGVLHALGNTDLAYPVETHLYRIEKEGALTDLTGHLDRSTASPSAGPAVIRWDDQDAMVMVEDAGTVGLIRVSPDAAVTPIVDGSRVVSSFDLMNGSIYFSVSVCDNPGEVHVVRGGAEESLTDLNHPDLGLVEPDHFSVDSEGHDVDVWVYLPEGEADVPLLLNVHGGPASQYGYGFFDEFQIYVSAGYGVVACNPRGSSGRGLDFRRAVVGEGWGKVDIADIRAVVTATLSRFPRLDATRMGVMGGSYGGFMTAWMIGQEDRWASAVVERALISWTSFSGTSDIGGLFPTYYTGREYPQGWDDWWSMGPLSLAHNVTTPTLIIHSENDWRCPIEQAEQYFMALLRNGTTAELIRFPDEGHEMSRSGSPRHRVERFEAILDWHDRHLA